MIIHPGITETLFALLKCSLLYLLMRPVGRVRLFPNYTISLSSLCRLIGRHWTTKMLVRCMLPSVCLRLGKLSQLSHLLDILGCVSSAYPLVMIVRTCTLSCQHHQIGSMNQQPLFRVRSWNKGMRCMSNYLLTDYFLHIWYTHIHSKRYVRQNGYLKMGKW